MKHRVAVFCATSALAMLVGCTQAPVANTDADVKALKDIEAQWNKDFEAKDAAKLAAHYTDDAVLFNPGAPASKGKDAIQKTLGEMVGDPAFALKFSPDAVDVAKSGDLAYTRGTYTMTMTDRGTKQPMTDHGSYITVYKKQADGTWKAAEDAAISEVPPPEPAPEKGKKK